MAQLNPAAARSFMHQLRAARLAALADAEAYDVIIHAVERLGSFLSKGKLSVKDGNLGKYKCHLETLVSPGDHDRFRCLYELVRVGRNDALHQGAFARHLTGTAIQLALVLEDSLSKNNLAKASDFMVRNPVCAEEWQLLQFVRQQMLANSFSHMPVRKSGGGWYLISDAALIAFLGADRDSDTRNEKLKRTVGEAWSEIGPIVAEEIEEAASTADALVALSRGPLPVVLVKHSKEAQSITGILTAFDLL